MKNMKVQSLRSLREEMKAVARGARPAPVGAGKPSVNSVRAIVRLLTPENRQVLGHGAPYGLGQRAHLVGVMV